MPAGLWDGPSCILAAYLMHNIWSMETYGVNPPAIAKRTHAHHGGRTHVRIGDRALVYGEATEEMTRSAWFRH